MPLVIIGGIVLFAAFLFRLRGGSVSIESAGSSDQLPVYKPDNLGNSGDINVTLPPLAPVQTGSTSGVRGIRNNNPGNIRHGKDKWQGMAAVQTDPAFVQFTEPKWGIRALGVVLRNYNSVYGLRTVKQIIHRWAPPTENNTAAYVSQVAKALGVSADQTIDVYARLPDLAAAIIWHENGENPYRMADIKNWVYL